MKRSLIISGKETGGAAVVSVLTPMRYTVTSSGRCIRDEEPVKAQLDFDYYSDTCQAGAVRAPILKRDIDCYAWREYTDLVVQGVARSSKPTRAMPIQLRCAGREFRMEMSIHATGDRWVERGPAGHRLTEAAPFTEMPIRYDRAYGGTDEKAEAKYSDPDELKFFQEHLDELEQRETSEYSYPRNPAGKGYLIDAGDAVGLPWPNLELPDDRLQLSRLSGDLLDWDRRPYPACFDWVDPSYLPRGAFGGLLPKTRSGRTPERELRLGLFPPDFAKKSVLERVSHLYSQASHPFLWGHRFDGDEELRVTAMSPDGRDFLARLPGERPTIRIAGPDGKEHVVRAVLDLVFAETEKSRLTLLWRGSLKASSASVPGAWVDQCTYRVGW